MQMEGPLRYRQLGNYANRRNIRIRHLRNRFNPLQEYHNEDFRSRFRLRKDSVIDRKNFGEGSSTSNKERTAANTNAASAYCFEILCHRNFNFQRVIGDIFGVSAFAAFAFAAKQRAQFLSFPENLADTKRKFYDVGHFPVWSGPSIVPTSGSYVQTKKMPWHLLTESSFNPSTSKPFVIAMPYYLHRSSLAWVDARLTYFWEQQDRRQIKGWCYWWHSCGWQWIRL